MTAAGNQPPLLNTQVDSIHFDQSEHDLSADCLVTQNDTSGSHAVTHCN